MTIFDSLRYPISMPPTEDEFTALPDKLFRAWLLASSWKNYGVCEANYLIIDISKILGFYEDNFNFSMGQSIDKENAEDLSLLRKMIKEYEPV